jgi:hypothetical protein
MVKTFSEQAQKTLEEKFNRFQTLKDREQELQARLKKTEEEQGTVNERIYLKVKADYEKQLRDISAGIAPLVDEIADTRESTVQELKTIETDLAAIEEEYAEAVFRHRVGEFDDARLKEVEASILPKIEEKRGQQEPLTSLLKRIDEAISNQPAEPEPQAVDSPPEDSTAPEPELAGINHDPTPFEFEKEDDAVIDAFISGLADPDKEATETNTASERKPLRKIKSSAANDTLIPFPNLIITAGNQSGKKIPLLPMTMTIGREHDNNIELKDEEVARYHARILFHDSQFVIEDLESSTGTWVNDNRVTREVLHNSDKIRLGRTTMVIDFS